MHDFTDVLLTQWWGFVLQRREPWGTQGVHPHLRNTDLTLLDLHKQISSAICESWAHNERGTNWQQLRAQKTNSLWFVLLVHSETKPERKRRKALCAQGVNCRYSVPNKKENRRHNPKCFLHPHTRVPACMRAHTHTQIKNKIPICWKFS